MPRHADDVQSSASGTRHEILTTMNSAVSQALIATGFNSDFYTVVATLIPVLFIAIAVQVPLFVRVFVTYQGHARARPYGRSRGPLDQGGLIYKIIFSASAWVLVLLLVPILIAGGWGELLAVYALYQQQDQPSTRYLVLVLTMLLIIAVPAMAVATFGGGVSAARTRNVETRGPMRIRRGMGPPVRTPHRPSPRRAPSRTASNWDRR